LFDRVMSAIPQVPVGVSGGAAAAVLILQRKSGSGRLSRDVSSPTSARSTSRAHADLVDVHERLDGEWRWWRQALEQ
jgi:hypothetical protein